MERDKVKGGTKIHTEMDMVTKEERNNVKCTIASTMITITAFCFEFLNSVTVFLLLADIVCGVII